jgi:hypothetical protein
VCSWLCWRGAPVQQPNGTTTSTKYLGTKYAFLSGDCCGCS